MSCDVTRLLRPRGAYPMNLIDSRPSGGLVPGPSQALRCAVGLYRYR
jgi:hypothetical protein